MGIYIAIEGIDGTGKSTQAARLAERYSGIVEAEPGGTPYAQMLREIVKDPSVTMGVEAEALLFASARADLLHTVIGPAREKDLTVISDRSIFSSLVYQGFRDGKNRLYDVWEANALATKGFTLLPDLVLQIDLDAETALSRRSGRGGDDRMEALTNTEDLIGGFNRVRQSLHTELRAFRTTWIKIDGLGTPDEVFEEMVEAIDKYMRNSHSDTLVVGERSLYAAMREADLFERADQIAIGASESTGGGHKKSHFFRRTKGFLWVSLCRSTTTSKLVRSTGGAVTCLRCSTFAHLVDELDFTESVDVSVNSR